MSRLPAPSAIATCLLTLVLSACSTQQHLPASGVQPERFEYISQQTVPADQTPEQVAQRLGGKVAFWHEASRTVVVGYHSTSSFQKLASGVTLESNPDTIELPNPDHQVGQLGGSIWAVGGSIWAVGGSIWAVGSLWNDLTYQLLPENSSAWNLLQLKEGHQKATALGKGVVVAVLDTGVDFEHVAWNSMAFVSPQLFHDYVDMDQYPKETGDPTQVGYGHGTGVTGVILQIAPQARILPLRVLDANGQGDTIHLASAIYAAVDGGANVINLSLGTNQRSTILETAIKYAQGKNVTIVASAGNDGVGTLLYPAAFSKDYKNVISVGSVSTALKKSTFSNYSPYLTLTGLGENISTTFPEDRKTTWSGTSFSAPEVSGAIALALSVNVNLTPDKILKHLSDTSTSYAAINSDQKNLLGSGLLNVNKFIDAVGKDL